MNRMLALICLALINFALVLAQTVPYRVVFDLTSRDSLEQKAVMRWVREISTSHPNAQLEVVMYGKGFEMVMPGRSTVTPELTEALKNSKATFAVCEVAMRSNKIDKSQLFPGVKTVPDGIYEIISKQREGWGYIKVMH